MARTEVRCAKCSAHMGKHRHHQFAIVLVDYSFYCFKVTFSATGLSRRVNVSVLTAHRSSLWSREARGRTKLIRCMKTKSTFVFILRVFHLKLDFISNRGHMNFIFVTRFSVSGEICFDVFLLLFTLASYVFEKKIRKLYSQLESL